MGKHGGWVKKRKLSPDPEEKRIIDISAGRRNGGQKGKRGDKGGETAVRGISTTRKGLRNVSVLLISWGESLPSLIGQTI